MHRMSDAIYPLIGSWLTLAVAVLDTSASTGVRIYLCVVAIALAFAALDLSVIHRAENRKPDADESEYVPPRDRLGL